MSRDAILLLDAQGKVTATSAGRADGHQAEDLVGKDYALLYSDEDRKSGLPARALEFAARSGAYESEVERRRKDGGVLRVRILLHPLCDAAGARSGFAEVMRVAGEDKLEAFSQLSGGIAHDFNNMLHVIKNAADALRRRLQHVDAQTASVIELVRRNADHAASVTQLLVHSRQEPLDAQLVDVSAMAAAMSELLRHTLGETIKLELVAGKGTWPVRADPRQLKGAILNIAVNAREAMPRGGVFRIESANAVLDERYAAEHEIAAGEYVAIALSDNGVGMAPQIAAKAFDPFFTTKDHGYGAGLGLSQAYAFIKRSHGHAHIRSALGKGTTLTLYLPRAAEAKAPRAKPRAIAGLRVLVVEDEALLAMTLADYLSELGCRTIGTVASMAEALDEALRAELDLVLLDVNLRGEAAYPVAAALDARRVPFVFMSGYGELEAPWRGRPAVQKPFELEDLRRAIERAL